LAVEYEEWEAIASLDIEAMDDTLTEEQLNGTLTFLREKKNSIDRIPTEIKIESITIDMGLLKNSLKVMLDQQIESLIQLIRNQIKK
jgi:hypothetical protein